MNSSKKKILIISMTAGFGHIRAGDALLDYARENLPAVLAEHVDIANLNPLFKKITGKFYDTASKKMPFVWGAIYKILNISFVSFLAKKIWGMDFLTSRNIKKYIQNKNPDGIIFTNIIPLFISDFSKMFPDIPMAVVVTDYHGHAYYYSPWLSYYFVPIEDVKKDLESIGVQKEKIIVTGIPINPRFYVQENIADLKIKYGIKSDLPIVLFIASFKISRRQLVDIVKKLLAMTPPVSLVCLANGNREFYEILKSSLGDSERFWLVNWTNVIEEYMKMADVVISKAGGLTVSECLALQKPLIMVNPIPGQEEYNAKFMEKNNFGIKAANPDQILAILPELLVTAKHKSVPLWSQENPCKKIFEYMLK